MSSTDSLPFYLRYYVGHKGKFGHEFMEFEITPDGKLRYANNSNYKNDFMIRKEVTLSKLVIEEIKRIVRESEVTREDDHNWPVADRYGRQELEIKIDREHISFTVSPLPPLPVLTSAKIGSLLDVMESSDPEGYRVFYYLIQDLNTVTFPFTMMNLCHCYLDCCGVSCVRRKYWRYSLAPIMVDTSHSKTTKTDVSS
eukprot:scaffold37_cov172-Ochromonas_danica.AAC.10